MVGRGGGGGAWGGGGESNNIFKDLSVGVKLYLICVENCLAAEYTR